MLQNIQVECSMDCLESSTDDVGLHTKAARLFHKIVGQNRDLNRFDALRLRFKGLKDKSEKPTMKEMIEYETLLVKLQNCILSIKYTTKNKLKILEKQCMATQGVHIAYMQSNADCDKTFRNVVSI